MKVWLLKSFEALGIGWAFVWGFWLASPWWDTLANAPAFSVMAQAGPDWMWGGIPMLTAVAVVVAHRLRRWIIKQILFGILMSFFVFASVIFALANWQGTAVITYLFLAAFYFLLAMAVRYER